MRVPASIGTVIAIALAIWVAFQEWNAEPISGAIHVIDGDTVEIDGTRYRAVNYDTPEFEPLARCDAEIEWARRATTRLRELSRQGLRVEPAGRRGGHNRPLAHFILEDGTDVADIMVGEGFAVYWGNGTPDWCR